MRNLSSAAGRKSRSAGNLVFSPLSMYSALSLAAAGAKGRTLSELLDALGAKSRGSLAENVRCMVERALPRPDGPPGPGVAVAHACGVWHDAATGTFKPAYRDVAAASCNAVVRAVDFLNKVSDSAGTWIDQIY
jgi:serpin B